MLSSWKLFWSQDSDVNKVSRSLGVKKKTKQERKLIFIPRADAFRHRINNDVYPLGCQGTICLRFSLELTSLFKITNPSKEILCCVIKKLKAWLFSRGPLLGLIVWALLLVSLGPPAAEATNSIAEQRLFTWFQGWRCSLWAENPPEVPLFDISLERKSILIRFWWTLPLARGRNPTLSSWERCLSDGDKISPLRSAPGHNGRVLKCHHSEANTTMLELLRM